MPMTQSFRPQERTREQLREKNKATRKKKKTRKAPRRPRKAPRRPENDPEFLDDEPRDELEFLDDAPRNEPEFLEAPRRPENEPVSLSDERLEEYLRTFRAANPAYQQYCVDILRGNVAQSQFSQDILLFRNFFWKYAFAGKKGFYVESGANDWKVLSNTFFFDICLGWDGLCVEPDSKYIANLQAHRTCKVLNMCIAASRSQQKFAADGPSGHISQGPPNIECDSLKNMLHDLGRTEVDFWSLDVESYEVEVLKTIDFSAVKINVMLVEDAHVEQCKLANVLLSGPYGLVQFMKLPIDSIFVHPTIPLPTPRWIYPKYQAHMNFENGKCVVKTF